ncbi:hypothetical protein LQ564_10810 [Massilia sp. G4R7]|uniref:Alpha/beta hydrolase family protein n=1 Tax=Massilia phyllostachyos TaxID=2898585 RepID=A0ABS8Q4Y6_9BURK|nr:hypothetical protein [Massilia phyllostachyos]MCD2516799.1 hypothetical protein [Massilia phyllostachyos]
MTTRATTSSAGLVLAGIGLASWSYVRAKSRQAEREHPPQGKFVEVDGVRLHYLERGSGPVLVLLHGNGVYTEDFVTSGLLDRAAEHYGVIAFERPRGDNGATRGESDGNVRHCCRHTAGGRRESHACQIRARSTRRFGAGRGR